MLRQVEVIFAPNKIQVDSGEDIMLGKHKFPLFCGNSAGCGAWDELQPELRLYPAHQGEQVWSQGREQEWLEQGAWGGRMPGGDGGGVASSPILPGTCQVTP